MARRKTNLTLEEELENTVKDLSTYEESVKMLRAKRKDLEERIKNKKVSDLCELIERSGKSIDDIKKMIDL